MSTRTVVINDVIGETCIKPNIHDIAVHDIAEDESEIYGTVAYLQKNNLVKCHNCGYIWDGCAQCNCWKYLPIEEDSSEDDLSEKVEMRSPPPDRPVPLPLLGDTKKIKELEEKIAILEKQNKILLEELSKLKQFY